MTNVEIFSAYLPYKVLCTNCNITRTLQGIDVLGYSWMEDRITSGRIVDVKLILKPLDTIDWLQCSKDLGEFLTEPMSEFIYNTKQSTFHILDAPYLLVQWLIKNHYDVFGAIEKGIAISE